MAAGVFVLGGYAVLFMETTGVLRLATVSTSAILVGVGYGLLSLVWQHRLSSLVFDDVVKTLLFALVIQSAGYLLLFAALARPHVDGLPLPCRVGGRFLPYQPSVFPSRTKIAARTRKGEREP